MYFDHENYIHPVYGTIPKRCVIDSITNYIQKFEQDNETKLQSVNKTPEDHDYEIFVFELLKKQMYNNVNNFKSVIKLPEVINSTFFSFVRRDLEVRIKNIEFHRGGFEVGNNSINPNLALLLRYTEFIPYEEIVYALYKNK